MESLFKEDIDILLGECLFWIDPFEELIFTNQEYSCFGTLEVSGTVTFEK